MAASASKSCLSASRSIPGGKLVAGAAKGLGKAVSGSSLLRSASARSSQEIGKTRPVVDEGLVVITSGCVMCGLQSA